MSEREIFLAAIEITHPQEREAWVQQACGTDSELKARVEALLKTHAQSSQFLETPASTRDLLVAQTLVAGLGETNDDSFSESVSGEAEFRKYLKPASRPGWMGRLGHYEIETILGRGAFGIVAKAFDEKLHRVVAIKLMNPELATTSPPRKRFLREARTAAAVTHENIVAIYAVEEEPLPYLVMEYISGNTLQHWMDSTGPFGVKDLLRIGQQVAAGLAAAHTANLIHRDIKPSNILLTAGPSERAKISDFGLARAVDDASMTCSGMIAGTPLYMAPEQARGEVLDARADLFSLGSVLYQLASGRPPFRGANAVAVLKRVCEDTPRPLHDILPETPGWLETIIFKLLEKNRNDRYQTAQEVADLLHRCQQEVEHDGRVKCVAPRPRAVQVQVAPRRQSTTITAKKRPMAWLLGGGIGMVVLALIVWGQFNSRKPTLAQPSTEQGDKTTSPSTSSASEAPAVAVSWQGWPTDAPRPAIAPFNTVQAKLHQEEWAAYLNVPVEYTNRIGMKFRLIPPGEFLMGGTQDQIDRLAETVGTYELLKLHLASEAPQHKVILTKPIYLGIYEVTQKEYEKVMGKNPSSFQAMGDLPGLASRVTGLDTSNFPVETMSWNDAAEFCEKLSQMENLEPNYLRSGDWVTTVKGTGYRLPTEAEWENACRAGTTTDYCLGNSTEEAVQAGWFQFNCLERTHAVGELRPNPFGLFDIIGNVSERVSDFWIPNYYEEFKDKAAIDPTGPPEGAPYHHVIRGGGWYQPPTIGQSQRRESNVSIWNDSSAGFRVALPYEAARR